MRGLILRWVLTAFALWLTSQLIPGIHVGGPGAAFFAALVLGVLNAFLRPLVLFLTLPINLVTLGLFTLIVNGFILWLTSEVVVGFQVHGFWSAVGGALMLSLISFALNLFVSDSGRIQYIYVERIGQ
ncbi:MAG TPA: phage holin family protein [Candidatus Binatia bacterium]|nr:phage holin family protein [Candidatus Binatia bacterium]